MTTGREDEFQLEVPPVIRSAVPARYGVEIVRSDPDPMLIISDQLRNRHIDCNWLEDFGSMPAELLRERVIMPMIEAMKAA